VETAQYSFANQLMQMGGGTQDLLCNLCTSGVEYCTIFISYVTCAYENGLWGGTEGAMLNYHGNHTVKTKLLF